MNISPNLEITIGDNSISSVPLDTGQAGFIMGAQWGPVNKAMSITNKANLLKMYSTPIYNTNHISYSVIERYLDYGVGAATVVRAAKDDFTTKNSYKMFSGDLTASSWNNGTVQFRKLNGEDDAYYSSELVIVEIAAADPSASPSVGDVLYKNGDTSIYGTIEAIVLIAENTGANSYVYIKNVTGDLYDGSDQSYRLNNAGGTEVIPAGESVTTTNISNTYFHEVELTLDADEDDLVAVGSTLTQGVATGLVVGKDAASNKIYLSNVSGTFTATDIDQMDGITYDSVVTVSSIASTSTIAQVLGIYAKYPGSAGNDIQVAFCNRNDFDQNYDGSNTFASEFEVTALEEDELALIVTYDGSVVERHIVSVDETATSQGGKPKFIDSYLEEYSNYIGSESVTTGTHVVSDIDDLTAGNGNVTLTSLVGGASGAVELQEAKDAYDVLLKRTSRCAFVSDFHELNDMTNFATLISYVAGQISSLDRVRLVTTLQKDAINPSAFVVSTSITDISSISNYYVYPYYEWTYVNNATLKRKYWVPISGDQIALELKTIKEVGDWYAPAGTQNGILQGVTRLYYNLEEGDGSPVSELYKYGVNAHVYREDDAGNTGYYAWGNRSKYNALSDLSRQNVVNAMLIDVQKLGSLIQPYIFQPIDDATFASITQVCDAGYLQNRAPKAFYQGDDDNGYKFICDRSNNDSQAASEKTIYVDFLVKYRPAAEYIKLRITVTAVGIAFELV